MLTLGSQNPILWSSAWETWHLITEQLTSRRHQHLSGPPEAISNPTVILSLHFFKRFLWQATVAFMWTSTDDELSFTGKDRERKISAQSNVDSLLLTQSREQFISTVLGHKCRESIPTRVNLQGERSHSACWRCISGLTRTISFFRKYSLIVVPYSCIRDSSYIQL